jgi:AcrR family transcriptional regulator
MNAQKKKDGARAAGGKVLRADAQRSEDALLEAAKLLFAERGVDAPIRVIAGKAGVGLATLYRRFPTRSDLIAAVFRREIDTCAAAAEELARAALPLAALEQWLYRYAEFLTTKKGLSAALHSGDPAFSTLPGYFRTQFEPALTGLLDAAIEARKVRAGIAPYDLLRAIGNLSAATGEDGDAHVRRMVDLLVAGLRLPSDA